MLSPLTIRKLARHEVSPTARLLAAAFADNPCYAFMHPREATRPRDLEAFFRRNLLWHFKHELTWVAVQEQGPSGESRVLGTVTLVPPGGVPSTPIGLFSHWVLPTLFQQGPQTVKRMIHADEEFKQRYLEDTLGLPYWHVHAVAVAPEAQHQGVGTRLLRHVLKELAQQLRVTPGPVVLSTQRERNLPFYRRLGFELTGAQQMGVHGGQVGHTSWFLRQTQLQAPALTSAPRPR
ncbi:MAG: GNAT family N-acetyltransferase [Myxococcales bacterium]